MQVFRLSRRKFAKPLSGKGAALHGGRWNSRGIELIYTAENRSLAMAEVAVHLTLATLPGDYVISTIEIPIEVSIQKLKTNQLPSRWNSFPYITVTREIGDKFVASNKYCVLQVPSAVTRGEFNFLINPFHQEFSNIRIIHIEKFPFDKRIFK